MRTPSPSAPEGASNSPGYHHRIVYSACRTTCALRTLDTTTISPPLAHQRLSAGKIGRYHDPNTTTAYCRRTGHNSHALKGSQVHLIRQRQRIVPERQYRREYGSTQVELAQATGIKRLGHEIVFV